MATNAALLPWRALGPGAARGLVGNSIVSHSLLVAFLIWSAELVSVFWSDDPDNRRAWMAPLKPKLLMLYSVPSTKAPVDWVDEEAGAEGS